MYYELIDNNKIPLNTSGNTMKSLFLITALTLCMLSNSFAQTDTLVITLKNKTVEKIAISQIQKMQFENVTAVDDQSKQSSGLSLNGNYPNPFGEQTSIEFEIENSGSVEIFIFDNSGKQIQKLQCNNCQSQYICFAEPES